jgi:hypothetical protein
MSRQPERFIVMNDQWKIAETGPGLFELTARDGHEKLGPIDGTRLVGVLAVVSELERYLRAGG